MNSCNRMSSGVNEWNTHTAAAATTTKLKIKRKFTFSNYFVIGFYCCLSFIIATLFPLDGCASHGRAGDGRVYEIAVNIYGFEFELNLRFNPFNTCYWSPVLFWIMLAHFICILY